MSNGVSYKQYGPHIWDVREKKPLSEKQREALAKGRQINRFKQYRKYIAEAERRFIPTEDVPEFKRIQFMQRVKIYSKSKGISIRQAFEKEMMSATFSSPRDRYVKLIQDYVNKTELRQALATIKGTNYTHTSVNWDEFQFNEHEFLYTQGPNGNIYLRLRPGDTSDDPDFVEITIA